MNRYSLQDSVEILGKAPETLRGKTVSIVGLGGVGSAIAEILARAGVNLRIIDKDRVYEEELPHLSLFSEDHISKFKAKEAKKILESLNSTIKVKAFHEELVESNAYLVEADVIIECSGNSKTAMLVDKVAKKTPIVYARSTGTTGQVFIAHEVRLKQVEAFLAKMQLPREGYLGSTVRLTAGLASNKALKIVLGQKIEKNYLVVDGWKFSFEKVTVRKDRKK